MADTLRIATCNIRNGRAFDGIDSWPFRSRRLVDYLRSLDADVLAIQEAFAFQVRAITSGLEGYTVLGSGRSRRRRGEHVPILVRRDRVEVLGSTTRWLSDTPNVPGSHLPGARFPRIATVVDLRDRRTDHTFTVANTHLDAGDADRRRRSAELLAEWSADWITPVLVGDLNATIDAPELGPLLAAGYRDACPADAPGTNHDFTGRTDGLRIDHVLVGPPWSVSAATVAVREGRPPTDHWAVVADLLPG
ncbi:MAG: endonuclease/exonuclease/phosphatase family protein [Actinobacteria bacterium]|nr:endonuclease/exonuclease/phosphatase family protein [Actinomycetota bacterium]